MRTGVQIALEHSPEEPAADIEHAHSRMTTTRKAESDENGGPARVWGGLGNRDRLGASRDKRQNRTCGIDTLRADFHRVVIIPGYDESMRAIGDAADKVLPFSAYMHRESMLTPEFVSSSVESGRIDLRSAAARVDPDGDRSPSPSLMMVAS